MFMAVSMSICAVPVIAKVLMDLKLIRRDIGQLILASAMTDDTCGWIMLSVVAGLATAGVVEPLSIAQAIGGALVFLGVMLTVGVPVFSRIISGVDKRIGGANAQMSLILALGFGAAALTHQMGIEAILGVFAVGILVGQAPRFRREVAHTLEMTTASFLAPIFFAAAGVKVDLTRVFTPEVAPIGLAVLGLACACKITGVYIGAWAARLSHWERLAMGFGMNARGAMEIVVATVGLGLGILTIEMYSIIVMVAIVTSLMAPPMLRWCLSRVKMGEHEARRLETEAVNASSFIRQIRRVLIVTRNASSVDLPAQIVGYLSHEQPIECTAVYARPEAIHVSWWQVWSRRARRYASVGALALERIARPLRLTKGLAPRAQAHHRPEPRRARPRRGRTRLRAGRPRRAPPRPRDPVRQHRRRDRPQGPVPDPHRPRTHAPQRRQTPALPRLVAQEDPRPHRRHRIQQERRRARRRARRQHPAPSSPSSTSRAPRPTRTTSTAPASSATRSSPARPSAAASSAPPSRPSSARAPAPRR
jgi:Kef-type K+ transport system membrane component KefB